MFRGNQDSRPIQTLSLGLLPPAARGVDRATLLRIPFGNVNLNVQHDEFRRGLDIMASMEKI